MADTSTKEVNMKIETFGKLMQQMININDTAYNQFSFFGIDSKKIREYTTEEIKNIIDNGTTAERIELSRNYFYKDGFYRRLIIYYAALLKYVGILIPNPSFGQQLSSNALKKRYTNAVNYLDVMNIPSNCENWTLRVLRDGGYYGVVGAMDKNHFAMIDLPAKYCRSNFKDINGHEIIEFNVQYFDSIFDKKKKELALENYPPFISSYYKKWLQNKSNMSYWCMIPTDMSICFQFMDSTGMPLFLNVIPAALAYDDAVETEKARELEEIRKILVQKVPHLQDGGLLFEPEEALEMHKGVVGMLKNNPNIHVLTTYADVEAIVSKTSNDNINNNLEKMMKNIYYESGTSSQLFASDSSMSLEISIKNDMSLVMILAQKYERVITAIINSLFANSTINFKYTFLPVTWYNEEKYIETSYKLANSGYSFLLPMVAMGFSQRDLLNIKTLENDVLKLDEVLIPLSSAFNSTGEQSGKVGRPELSPTEKSEKTIANEKSLDKGGSN